MYIIAILTQREADAAVLRKVLESSGVGTILCGTVEELCCKISEGADGAVTTDKALSGAPINLLRETLASQPEWSSFPLIVLSNYHQSQFESWGLLQKVGYYGHLQFLERPAHTMELVSAVKSAITSRKRQYQVRDELNRRIEVENKLKEESRRKNEFLALLGHELRNPLATLDAALEMTRRQPVPDRQKWYDEVIEKQVVLLRRLVGDLIDVSRISRGKIELRKETIALREQMTLAVEAVTTVMEERRQRLHFTPPDCHIILEADPVRLQQIFINLLKNAAFYTPPGGEVMFSAGLKNCEAVITCRDNGIGIRKKQLEAIFEPFMEVDSHSGHSTEGGLGIGLALVKQLVELHGGTVHAESGGKGKGSEFIVRLPLAAAAAASPYRAAEKSSAEGTCGDADAPARQLSIMLVEDNPDFSALLAETLKDLGHRVSIESSGIEAVRRIIEEQPDYAIIDIGLNGMDGYQVAGEIRGSPAGTKVKLIALSGYNPDRERAAELFDHYVIKGSGIDRIFSIICRG